jgi:mono/diheme cytochrome c family protein
MRTKLAIVGAAVIALLIVAAVVVLSGLGGFSARAQPTSLERVVARLARRMAVPRNARDARNPVAFTPAVWQASREHFADHCAVCHGNDGRGDTEIGRNLYPKAPDMRLADTQTLTDGELYWIIENGVRLTGMPAWGSGTADDEDSWKLVHFVRHLNDLTPEQLDEMEALNPKTPAELEEEREDRSFLQGDDADHPHDAESHVHSHKEQR